MVYSICSIATARGILFYKSSIWKLNVEYGRFAFRDGERAEKFVLCVCFPVMQQIVFTQFLLNVSATIKFRYFNLGGSKAFLLPYFEKLIFTTYIRQIFNQLSSQISSYLNNRNLKIIISKISRSNPKHFLNLRIDSLRDFKKEKALL